MRIVLILVAVLAFSAPAASAAPQLVVERTGGIAGVNDRLVIARGGAGTVTHRTSPARRLKPRETRAVRAALRAADLPTLARAYRPRGVVNDGFVLVLRAGGHTVRVEQGAEDVPARLRALMAAAVKLLD